MFIFCPKMYLIWTHGTLKCDVKVLNIGPSDQSWCIPLLPIHITVYYSHLGPPSLMDCQKVHFRPKSCIFPNLRTPSYPLLTLMWQVFLGKLTYFYHQLSGKLRWLKNCRCQNSPKLAKMPILAVFRAQSQVWEHQEQKWVILTAYFILSHLLL